ncbi:MAG: T9SS type A sorting domain-containing protein, partial [Bacteroidota bacterium]|nr:T9SS type A sorting domain-containing protein [Bacteroidota bacterium]
ETGNTGEISLSTSETETVYWVTMGAAIFTGETAGNGASLSLGSNYPAGTFDVWSSNEFGCELLQGSVTFVEDNGNNKLTVNITFGTPATNFPAGEAVISLYKLTTDIGGEEVIALNDQQTLGSNGQVIFEDIEAGDYYLGSALINPDNYNVASHVYYQTAITHEDAISIPMTDSTLFVADLHHPQLADEEGSNSGGGIVGEGGKKSDLIPLANMVVILRDADAEEFLDVCLTNDQGQYSFPNIPDNTNIQMYVTSLEHQQWTPFNVITETGTYYTVDFVVNGEEVGPVGIENTPLPNIEFSIYPNPAKDILYVTTSYTKGEISIYDINGKLIQKQAIFNNNGEISVSNLSAGTYTVVLTNKNGEVGVQKFVKE